MADQEFQMVLDLVDNASEVIDKVKDKLTDLLNSAGPTGKAIATGFGVAAVGIGVAIGALELMSQAADNAINKIAGLADQANRLGVSVEELQQMTRTFEAFGVPLDRSVDAMTDLSERIGEARQGSGELLPVLERLNVPLKAANGEWRSWLDVADELTAKLINTEDASDRVRMSAQAGGDAYRDLIGNVAQMPEEFEKVKQKAGENLLINNQLADAMRRARIELVQYNQQQEDSATIAAASMVPLSRWWKEVKTDIGLSTQGILQFFGLLDKSNGAIRMAELSREIKVIETDIDRMSKGEGGPLLFLKWSNNVERATYNLNKLKKEYQDLESQLPKLPPPRSTTVVTQTAEQLKAATKAQEQANAQLAALRAANIRDFDDKANAELAITVAKLQKERDETIKSSYLTGEALKAYEKTVDDLIAQEKISTQQKIADNAAKLAKQQADEDKRREEEAKRVLNAEIQAQDRKKKAYKDLVKSINNEAESQRSILDGTEKQYEVKQNLIKAQEALNRELKTGEISEITNATLSKQSLEDQVAKQEELKAAAEKNAQDIQQIYENAAQNIQGAFSDFFFDVMQGNLSDLADSFKKTIDRMVAELLAANLFKLVGGIGTGTAGESNLSGFFASIFGGISGRATGGPTTAGRPYWVGEEGPEIVIPSASSTVVPTDLSMAMASGNGSSSQPATVNNITIKALDAKSVIQLIEDNDRAIVTKLSEASQRYGL